MQQSCIAGTRFNVNPTHGIIDLPLRRRLLESETFYYARAYIAESWMGDSKSLGNYVTALEGIFR